MIVFMQIKGWKLRKSILLQIVNWSFWFHWDEVLFRHVWASRVVGTCNSLIQVGKMCHKMHKNRDCIDVPMIFQSLRINWILVLPIYYSTQNGFIRHEVCSLSGSLAYNHYYHCVYISKMANFSRLKHHKTTISTELSNLHIIENQIKIAASVIGILIDLIK